MVLNEIFSRKTEAGRITYYNPSDVEIELDDAGQAHPRDSEERRPAGRIRRHTARCPSPKTTASTLKR